MSWKFKPDDFASAFQPFDDTDIQKDASEFANDKLEEWKRDATVVYGYQGPAGVLHYCTFSTERSTHRGLLIDITELPKVPCKHEPTIQACEHGLWTQHVCKHCGVKLQATWSEVGE